MLAVHEWRRIVAYAPQELCLVRLGQHAGIIRPYGIGGVCTWGTAQLRSTYSRKIPRPHGARLTVADCRAETTLLGGYWRLTEAPAAKPPAGRPVLHVRGLRPPTHHSRSNIPREPRAVPNFRHLVARRNRSQGQTVGSLRSSPYEQIRIAAAMALLQHLRAPVDAHRKARLRLPVQRLKESVAAAESGARQAPRRKTLRTPRQRSAVPLSGAAGQPPRAEESPKR